MIKGKKRFIMMGIVGVIIFFILNFAMRHNEVEHNKLWDLLACIIITIFVWEGNTYIDNRLNTQVPWQKSVKKRIC